MKYIVLILGLLLMNCQSTQKTEKPTPSLEKATVVTYENLDATKFKEATDREDVVIIDVRTPEEIALGKIDNAIELDFYDKEFADKLLAMDKDKEYYIYCKGGGRSAKACRLMIKNGFEKVHNLDGGYTSWKKVYAE